MRHDVSIVFDDVILGDRVTLRALMAGQPIDFRPNGNPQEDDAHRAFHPARRSPAEGERRGQPRRRFHRHVLGGAGGQTRVLMGRDISEGGMRVEREPDFRMGERIRLAVYAREDEPPVMLSAAIDRDDGDRGWFLRFERVDPDTTAQLRHLLASLAPLDPRDPVGQQTPWIVSEVIEDV